MGKTWRVISLVGLMWFVGAPTVLAAPDASSADDLVAALNGARSDDGLAPLEVRGDLSTVAAGHATRMADEGRIFHNSDLESSVEEWEELGENVGVAPTVKDLHDALMRSPGHRRNILSDRFNHVGIAVERRGDRIYAVQVFRRLMTAAAPTTSSPTPAAAAVVPDTRRPLATGHVVPAPAAGALASAPAGVTPSTPLPATSPPEPAAVAAEAPAEFVTVAPARPERRVHPFAAPVDVPRRTAPELVFTSVALLAVVVVWCGRVVLSSRAPANRRRLGFASVPSPA